MSRLPSLTQGELNIFAKLKGRGVCEYAEIKEIVNFQIPQAALFFVERFQRKTLEQVLAQLGNWKKYLKTDFLLLPDQKARVQQWIAQTEMLTCNALLQANYPKAGDWELRYSWVPTTTNADRASTFIRPGLEITATNSKTAEVRTASISGTALHAWQFGENPFEKAFRHLGIWETLRKGSLRRYLVSSRKPQGWPLYSQWVIPRLYEFLLPHYSEPRHHSEQRDQSGKPRQALFPKALLKDMLEILRREHPQIFVQTTLNQLKASIQRHLVRMKAKSTKSPD